MGLRDTLLAASLGATMVAGTNGETTQNVTNPTTPTQARSISKAERQEMNFKKNYHYLYQNVDGAWFSFGDEKKMRQALYDIGSFAMGREVIANIPENMEFGSANFMPTFETTDENGNTQKDIYGGSYNFISNTLIMNTDILEKEFEPDSLINATECIFHELLHAYQQQKGISLMDKPSVDESMHSQKLIEAEAFGWNRALAATRAFTNGNYYITPHEVKAIMQIDLVDIARHLSEAKGLSFNEQEFKQNDFTYQLQQALIACKGNYDLAQKKVVGQIIKESMTNCKNKKWQNAYEHQAFEVTKTLSQDGHLSKNGNPAAYQKMLKYYQDQYGLRPSDIQLTLNAHQQKRVDNLKKERGESTVSTLKIRHKNTGR